jgi:hypothetical protein
MGKRHRPERPAERPAATVTVQMPPAPKTSRWRLLPWALLLAVALAWSLATMSRSVDLWISLAGGRHILAHGVDSIDPFSSASLQATPAGPGAGRWERLLAWAHPRGWINQNWLSHVWLIWLASRLGLGALFWWKLVVYALVAGGLVATARLRGAGWELSMVAAAAVVAVAREFWEIRAQDHTNLLLVGLLLVLAMARRQARWVWAAVPLVAVWANTHGGFVYAFVVLGVLTAWEGGRAWRQGSWSSEQARSARRHLAVLGASLLVAVVASPYRLANLTHPVEVSLSPYAQEWRLVGEWRPLWDPAGFGTRGPFLGLVGLAVVLLIGCVRRDRMASGFGKRRAPGPPSGAVVDWSDVALLVVTLAMATLSRRFLPILAILLAPLLAVWGQRLLDAWRPAGHPGVRRVALGVCCLAVGIGGLLFGLRFRRVYLQPWPPDAAHASLLDRLTHTFQWPHGACEFLRLNDQTGTLFAFWQETGYVMWAQDPEPATGRLPVQVFIDGRAQGAYPIETFRRYIHLRDGGPTGGAVKQQERRFTPAEANEVRAFLQGNLRALGVNLALIPAEEARIPISQALFNTPGWQVVYMDHRHSLLADTTTPEGKALAEGVWSGTTRFPAGESGGLTRCFLLLQRRDEASGREALTLARQVLAQEPSQRAVVYAVQAGEVAGLGDELDVLLRATAESYLGQREVLLRHDGTYGALEAALAALGNLQARAQRRGDTATAAWAAERLALCRVDDEAVRRFILW